MAALTEPTVEMCNVKPTAEFLSVVYWASPFFLFVGAWLFSFLLMGGLMEDHQWSHDEATIRLFCVLVTPFMGTVGFHLREYIRLCSFDKA